MFYTLTGVRMLKCFDDDGDGYEQNHRKNWSWYVCVKQSISPKGNMIGKEVTTQLEKKVSVELHYFLRHELNCVVVAENSGKTDTEQKLFWQLSQMNVNDVRAHRHITHTCLHPWKPQVIKTGDEDACISCIIFYTLLILYLRIKSIKVGSPHQFIIPFSVVSLGVNQSKP